MRSLKHILGFVAVFFVLLVAGKISKAHLWQAWVSRLPDMEVRNSHQMDEQQTQAQLASTAILRVSRLQSTTRQVLVHALASVTGLLPVPSAPALVRIELPRLPRLVARRDFLLSAPPMAP